MQSYESGDPKLLYETKQNQNFEGVVLSTVSEVKNESEGLYMSTDKTPDNNDVLHNSAEYDARAQPPNTIALEEDMSQSTVLAVSRNDGTEQLSEVNKDVSLESATMPSTLQYVDDVNLNIKEEVGTTDATGFIPSEVQDLAPNKSDEQKQENIKQEKDNRNEIGAQGCCFFP